METGYGVLIARLDAFIRKYYKNQLIRGALYAIAFVTAIFIIVNILEYFAYFGILARTIIFWLFIIVNTYIIARYIIIPLLRLFRIGKILSHEEAARVIGKHFTEVNDSLLNTLQLKELSLKEAGSNALLEASIEQKTKRLHPIPFASAINLKHNRKYLKFALPPLAVLLVILIASPGLITGPSERILEYRTYFERPAPFQFEIMNKKLEAVQQEDYILDVKVRGDEVPEEVFIVTGGGRYRMIRENTVSFRHTFKNLQKEISFFIEGDGYRSKDYLLKLIARPVLVSFELELDYPSYTGKKDETLQNSGDIVVPEGTMVKWNMSTRDARKVIMGFVDKKVELKPERSNFFSFMRQFRSSQNYSVKVLNDFMVNKDTMGFTVSVVSDQYPGIQVETVRDSVYDKRMYFTGNIQDDYGCSNLLFRYRKIGAGGEGTAEQKLEFETVPIQPGVTQQQFYFFYDLTRLGVEAGDQVEYYFEVWDNDGVNGSKSTRTQKYLFKAPTLEELNEMTEQSNEQIKQKMEDAIRQTEQLQRELEKLDKKMTDKKTLNFQEKKQVQDLLQQQQDLQLEIEKMSLMQQQNNIREQEYKDVDPELVEKQKQLEKLFQEVMTDEMKELFRQLQEMMDKLDKKQVNEMIDKMQLTNEDMKKELDRNLELFKQLEFDKKLSETIEELNKLAEEQEKLANESKNDKVDSEDLKLKQDELNKKFEELREELKKLNEMNNALEEPKDLKNTEQQEEDIESKMQQSSDQLGKNKKQGASKSQQEAAEQMEEMADQMQQMQNEMNAEEQEEDINALRQILENLVSVSINQEALMKQFGKINLNDPRFVKMMDRQKEIKDDVGMIKDSLYALSKRQPMIESFVNKEISDIDREMMKILEALHNRSVPMATGHQQYVMTSVNNLALILAESLDQMQQQMQNMANSSCKGGKCKKKSGQGKPSAGTMKQLQEQLNKQMQQLKEQMEGKSPGGKGGNQSMSEQLARLAAQQEALRKMLQEFGEEDKRNGGKNSGNISEMMKAMEQTEQDLVNKMITNETMKRQQEILTRLLESEKAEKERELDEKRESNESKNHNYSNPNDFFKYNRIKSKDQELLKTVPPTMNSFYKQKVNEYFYNFVE